MKPQLSVVIPVTKMAGRLENVKRFLKESRIFSAKIEIFIVHDIQDKETSIELKEILGDDKNVILIEDYFGSPGTTRNAGLERATGKWLVFWDSDDLPDIKETIQILEADLGDVECIICGFKKLNTLNGNINNAQKVTAVTDLAKDLGIWRIIFARESIGDLKFSNLRMAEDQLFILRYQIEIRKIRFEPEAYIYTYFQNLNFQATSNQVSINDLPRFLKFISFANYYEEKSPLYLMILSKQSFSALKLCSKSHKPVIAYEIFKNIGMNPLAFLFGLFKYFRLAH